MDESLEERRDNASDMALMIVGLRDGRFPVDSRSLSPGLVDMRSLVFMFVFVDVMLFGWILQELHTRNVKALDSWMKIRVKRRVTIDKCMITRSGKDV